MYKIAVVQEIQRGSKARRHTFIFQVILAYSRKKFIILPYKKALLVLRLVHLISGVHISSMCAELLQSCLTLCDLMDCSPPGSSVHGILQVRILKGIAISFSRGSSWPRAWTCVSCISHSGRHILYLSCYLENPHISYIFPKHEKRCGGGFFVNFIFVYVLNTPHVRKKKNPKKSFTASEFCNNITFSSLPAFDVDDWQCVEP